MTYQEAEEQLLEAFKQEYKYRQAALNASKEERDEAFDRLEEDAVKIRQATELVIATIRKEHGS